MIIIPKIDLDTVERNCSEYKLVDYYTKRKKERFLAYRVQCNISNISIIQAIKNIVNLKLHRNKIDSNKIIKKSVRIDQDIYENLLRKIYNDEICFSKTVRGIVSSEISVKEIDLIKAKGFSRKITVYYTEEQYKYIKQVINSIKSKGLKWITFSSLARSILYKRLGLAIDATIFPEYKKLHGVA